jgi:hypothetical protein
VLSSCRRALENPKGEMMYTDEDIDDAVKSGVFTETSVAAFRAQYRVSKNTFSVDEENFRLLTSFNDIFVVIACLLLLFSSLWALSALNTAFALSVFSLLAWGLAEFFVLKKKMALPAIVLLLSFVGGIFALGAALGGALFHSGALGGTSSIVGAVLSVAAAYFHWRRFSVPITVAAGMAAAVGFFVASFLSVFHSADGLLVIFFVGGILAFLLAMYWDASDRKRITRRADVAFWLHLLSAPLIIHPVFSSLGILKGQESLNSALIVILLYGVMTFISLVVDRRAFMVSSSIALTGVLIGILLLLLSAFWHGVRAKLVVVLPFSIRKYVPAV